MRSTLSGALILVAALGAPLAVPLGAGASTTVSVNGSKVTAASDPGEANLISVDLDSGSGNVEVDDDGPGVSAIAPCFLAGGHAECPLGAGDLRINVLSADRNDIVVEGLLLVLYGPLLESKPFSPIVFNLGDGNDRAQGGFGTDQFSGGAGNDLMIGLEGNDTMYGGPGNDVFDKQDSSSSLKVGLGRDRYLGGPGNDRIRARDFTRDLRIDCGPGGGNAQRDRFDPGAVRCG